MIVPTYPWEDTPNFPFHLQKNAKEFPNSPNCWGSTSGGPPSRGIYVGEILDKTNTTFRRIPTSYAFIARSREHHPCDLVRFLLRDELLGAYGGTTSKNEQISGWKKAMNEDVSPIKKGGFPMSCSFYRRVYVIYMCMESSWNTWNL